MKLSSKEKKAFKEKLSKQVSTLYIISKPDIVVTLDYTGDHYYNVLGWSTCGKNDIWSVERGKSIAFGRALDKLANKLNWILPK